MRFLCYSEYWELRSDPDNPEINFLYLTADPFFSKLTISPSNPLVNARVIPIANDVPVRKLWKTSIMQNGGPVLLHKSEGEKVLYCGPDMLRADAEYLGENNKRAWQEPRVKKSTSLIGFQNEVDIIASSKNHFKIVNASCCDDRCLLFTSISGGLKGEVMINKKRTSCQIIGEYGIWAPETNRIGVASILEPGKDLTLVQFNNASYQVETYRWDGKNIVREIHKWNFNDCSMEFEKQPSLAV